jgi:hypothetical protein
VKLTALVVERVSWQVEPSFTKVVFAGVSPQPATAAAEAGLSDEIALTTPKPAAVRMDIFFEAIMFPTFNSEIDKFLSRPKACGQN